MLALPAPKSTRTAPSFNYDHRVWFKGVTDSQGKPVLDAVASEALETAYLNRKIARIIAKGRDHRCVYYQLEDLEKTTTRQQFRSIARKLSEQDMRQNKPCHEPQQMKPGSKKWRRTVKAVRAGGA